MRKLIICGAVAALGLPAFADTLKEVTTKGIQYEVQGQVFAITFTEDGKFADKDSNLNGTWKIADGKLCTTSNLVPNEECIAFPADKKSGDKFEIASASGPATVTIK